ncbi:MAG: ribonucleotide reductase N-terminal alpha domain-containing protein [Bacillota bacterium]|nr:ribonucleotide reductase N-terminal alpha domain-containing protein [Bacillota bacterium]
MDLSQNARITYEKRYLIKDEKGNPTEKPEDLLRRVSANIASIEKNYGKDEKEIKNIEDSFYNMMAKAEFMPNSPTLMNAGRELQQLSACFVLPLEDSMEGIFTALKNMALVQKTGGGTGFAFDRLRPNNDLVRSTNGVASGPISFLKIFDAATEAVKQGGTRRGANMGSLIYNHPNILDFIVCKEKEDEINNFNLSVTVSDQFMRKAIGDDPDPLYNLINPRTKEKYCDPETGDPVQLDAREVFDLIVQKAWGKGDPGIIFIDRMNQYNPTPNIGIYETTNPCVPGDTFVMTTAGPKTVKNLIGVKSTLIINGEPYQTGNKGFYSTGEKQLLSIKTKEGFKVRATADHRLLRVNKKTRYSIDTKWIEAGALKPGDQLILHNHQPVKEWPGLYSEDEGYLIGLLIGDGTLKKDKALLSAWPDHGNLGIVNKAFEAAQTLPCRADFKGWWKVSNRSEYRMSLASLKKVALTLGMRPGDKTITPFLETATSSAFSKGMLKGIFDADGSVQGSQKKGISVRLAQSDLARLEAIQRMLARFGVISTIYAERRKEGRAKLPDGKGSYKLYKTKAQHELVITKDNLIRFSDKVGFNDTAKNSRLAAALKQYKRQLNRERYTITIESITPDQIEEVYDVQVPGINSFDANGIVVHNCGEQPLLPYEACCLGSINLGKFVSEKQNIEWDKLAKTVKTAVRFLDNVIDASNYVIPEIAAMHKEGNRKIGLGIMGWHDMLVRLGITYDSEKAIETAEEIMKFINYEAKKESYALAAERDVYPNFKGSIHDTGRDEDRVRNATRTTIAPTGTISILAGASSGIEPYFSIAFIRKNILGGIDLPEVNPVFLEIAQKEGFYSEGLIQEIASTGKIPEDSDVPNKYKNLFKTAMEIDFSWHVRHQAAFQRYTDNAVSKTINLKQEATADDVKNAYITAWEAGCKGITIYRDSSRTKQVLNVGDGNTEDTLKPTKRPKTLSGNTTSIRTALGNLFVTVNTADGRPFELFAQIGKAGSDVVAFTEAIARLISLALRCGVSVDEIVTQLEGIGGARSVGFGPNRIMSVPDAIGQALRKLALFEAGNEIQNGNHQLELCPDCGTCALIRAEGCLKCEACGFSEC